MLTNQKSIRKAFWNTANETGANVSKKRIRNHAGDGLMYDVDTRVAFSDFIDNLLRGNQITEKMANKVTL